MENVVKIVFLSLFFDNRTIFNKFKLFKLKKTIFIFKKL